MLRPDETRANGYTSQALMHLARNRYRAGDFVQWQADPDRWGRVLGLKGQHDHDPDRLLVRQLGPTSEDVLAREEDLAPFVHAAIAEAAQQIVQREGAMRQGSMVLEWNV